MKTWEDTWLMRFNISKCFVMKVTQSRKYKVCMNNSTLNAVIHRKYLGVVLQSDLWWSKHIAAKANSTLSMIRRNIKKAPKPVREKLYLTLVRPQLDYASSVWLPWLRQDILELEKVQRRAARFVHNNYWPLASVTQIISSLDWETLEARRQKACLTTLYKTINGFTTISMDHYQYSSATFIRSFHGQNCVLPFCRTDTYKHSFFPETICRWNCLPR